MDIRKPEVSLEKREWHGQKETVPSAFRTKLAEDMEVIGIVRKALAVEPDELSTPAVQGRPPKGRVIRSASIHLRYEADSADKPHER